MRFETATCGDMDNAPFGPSGGLLVSISTDPSIPVQLLTLYPHLVSPDMDLQLALIVLTSHFLFKTANGPLPVKKRACRQFSSIIV